ncbi:MAG: hypothetical protein COW73_10515 [Nitrospirae bacterium CG18_big_fil_WC_8_21_14_2_50_70_55]|nr:hypothetical protein [Deltaproteobacteria bacterium]OIP67244.1 MAG: hypothetical protein AUK30_00850 [Nitrospirae bacterium CG2_30_70_394]PIQ03640.1 MAG: hypothetical protein COW73_10515 [Nitrospirae bacterium CG18_big_fil_WC_8_21_14_2_50_70_55]PIU77279.1 MAG: hypothetical protein COS73_11395 [Nitrospirae bacterium CG06_land_8_20_14_3_00_70_43]PIW83250.1 MAG: hypothetical protein COZ96_04400 [Nitrospirae bacterium CG_4_8_14_3_um_filter_70_85]PIX82686.1 MAG: hypothetical protein COZ33_09345 
MAAPFLTPTLTAHGRRLVAAVGEGSILVTGEPGVGKSCLVDHWLGAVERASWLALSLPDLGQRPPLRQVADHLGVGEAADLAAAAATLAGRPLLVRVDPAERLVESAWHHLVALREALPAVHYLWVGRLEVKGQMEASWLRPLVDDIVCRVHLLAFDPEESRAYCAQYLATCHPGATLTEAAHATLYGRALGYVPLADQVLDEAVAEGRRRGATTVEEADVAIAIDTLRGTYRWRPSRRRWPWFMAAAAAAAGGIALLAGR